MKIKDWHCIGNIVGNDGVSTLLNNHGIGKIADVSISAKRDKFTVWANENNNNNIAGYIWKVLGSTGSSDKVVTMLIENHAEGAIVSINSKDTYVVWGYVES